MSEMNGSKALKRNGDASPKSGKATQNGAAEYLWLPFSRGSRDALPKSGKAADSPVPDLLNPSAGDNIERVIAELEKQRAELFTLACAAEVRAQAAEEKREAAENYARSLARALAEANRKRAKAEAIARAAEEKAQRMKAFFLEAEGAAREATKRQLLFGFLVFENRSAEAVAGAKPRKDAKLPNSWREFGEFAEKIAKSLDKMLISLFRQTWTPSRPQPLARQSSNLPDTPR